MNDAFPERAGATEAPRLARSLEPRHLTMISIGGIIGAGLFVGSGAAIASAGPAILLSYLLTGALVVMVMRMIGEMALAHPEVRMFTDFPRLGLGPGAGFVAGWLYWYFWMIVIPVEAIAGAVILQEWIPLPTWQLGLGIMAAMTAVNLLSTRSYGEFDSGSRRSRSPQSSPSSRSRRPMFSAGRMGLRPASPGSRNTADSRPSGGLRCSPVRSRSSSRSPGQRS